MDSTITIKGYEDFFEEQRRYVDRLSGIRLVGAIVMGIVLMGLLVFLKSPVTVWLVVTVLYGVAYYGLFRLRTALSVTSAALSDLEAVARFLRSSPPPAREDVLKFIKDKIKPDDSNVPEALWAFSSGQQNSEGVRAVANSAFSQPTAELSFAQFLRTALVLGGLFGTVLFFAVELGGTGLLSGDVLSLLPGLRGALASTLTGILGSLTVGWLSSSVEQVLERSTWEAESLIGGPLAQALATSKKADVVNEVDLWMKLIEEVQNLKDETVKSYGSLRINVGEHTMALETLSGQLKDLPAVQVPQQLANLQDVVRDFLKGTELLNASATTLVNAVGTLGAYAPAKTLEELAIIRTSVTSLEESAERSFQDIANSVETSARNLNAGIGSIQIAASQLVPAVAETKANVDAVGADVTHALGQIEMAKDASERSEARLQSIEMSLASAGHGQAPTHARPVAMPFYAPASAEADSVAVRADRVLSKLAELEISLATIPQTLNDGAVRMTEGVEAMRSAEESATRNATLLASKIDEVTEYQRGVNAVSRRLIAIQSWHERAARAPLMKFLTLPFWSGGKVRRADGA